MKVTRKLTLLSCIFLTLSACSTRLGNNGFQLFILNDSIGDLHLRYQPTQTLPILLNADTGNSLYVIGLQEIEHYDWDTQVITLTEDATRSLLQAVDTATGSRNQIIIDDLYQELNSETEDPLIYWDGLEAKAFVVKINSKSLYGGTFLSIHSQMAIDYPVIRVTIVDRKITFAVLPMNIPLAEIDSLECAARDETVCQVQRLIRDDHIKLLIEKAGKLK